MSDAHWNSMSGRTRDGRGSALRTWTTVGERCLFLRILERQIRGSPLGELAH
jgi:hypothetical protein